MQGIDRVQGPHQQHVQLSLLHRGLGKPPRLHCHNGDGCRILPVCVAVLINLHHLHLSVCVSSIRFDFSIDPAQGTRIELGWLVAISTTALCTSSLQGHQGSMHVGKKLCADRADGVVPSAI